MTATRQVLMVVSCVLIALVTFASSVTSAGKPTRRTIVVPANTTLDVRLATAVASSDIRGENRPDPPHPPYPPYTPQVLASLAKPVIIDGVSVAPAASVVLGNIIVDTEREPTDGDSEFALQFDRLRVGASTYRIRTVPIPLPREPNLPDDHGVQVTSGTRFRLQLLDPVSIEIANRF